MVVGRGLGGLAINHSELPYCIRGLWVASIVVMLPGSFRVAHTCGLGYSFLWYEIYASSDGQPDGWSIGV